MAFASFTLSSRPRGVTCGEIGMVARIAAANSRLMTDQVFMTDFPPHEIREPRPNLTVPEGRSDGVTGTRGLHIRNDPNGPEFLQGASGTHSPYGIPSWK